jgi:hypothetical protein
MLALPCARGSTGWLERKRCSSAFWLLPGWLPHSPYPGFGNQPEFHRLDSPITRWTNWLKRNWPAPV